MADITPAQKFKNVVENAVEEHKHIVDDNVIKVENLLSKEKKAEVAAVAEVGEIADKIVEETDPEVTEALKALEKVIVPVPVSGLFSKLFVCLKPVAK